MALAIIANPAYCQGDRWQKNWYLAMLPAAPLRNSLSAPTSRQESTYAGAESPILMEIDVSMRAENVALLIYHPHVKRGKDKGPRSRDNFAGDSLSDEEDFNDLPDGMSLRRQHSGGSVIIGDGEGELSTHDAIDRRDALRLPPLAAVITIEVSLGLPGCLPSFSPSRSVSRRLELCINISVCC